MAAASSFYDSVRATEKLALNLPVDKQYNQRTDYRHDKATKIKPVHLAKTEEGADPATDYSTDDTENYGNDKTTAVFPRHNPLG